MKTKDKIQVTICNGCIQNEKANQRVQLSFPAYDWSEIKSYYMIDFMIMFDYVVSRSPFAYIRNSEKGDTKTTDFSESFSLN